MLLFFLDLLLLLFLLHIFLLLLLLIACTYASCATSCLLIHDASNLLCCHISPPAACASCHAAISRPPASLHLVLHLQHFLISNASAPCCAATCCLPVPLLVPLHLAVPPPLVEPLNFGCLLCCPPSARAPCLDYLLLHSSLCLLKSSHLSLRHCLLSRTCLLLPPSHLAGYCVSFHLPALLLIEPLLFGWLLCCLPSAGASASHQATASCCSAASCQPAPLPVVKLPPLVTHSPLVAPLSLLVAVSPL